MILGNLPIGKVKGLDVSSYQGNIDWKKVANQGYKFTILRSALKSGNLDTHFEQNYFGAKSAGLEVDVYQFSYALSIHTAIEDANNLIAKLNGKKVDIWLDLEWATQGKLGKDTVTEIAIAYINECKRLGYKCNIYSNTSWYKNYYHADKLRELGCKFWIAKYGVNDGIYDESRKPNIGEFIWQYTSKGQVDGISGNTDLNMMYVEEGEKMANTVDKILELARIEEGYIEKASNSYLDSETANKGTNNYQKYSRDVNEAGLKGYQGQPWCITHQFWLDLKCFGKEAALKLWNMTPETYVGYNCFSTYNVFKNIGKVGKEPKVGALVIFTFSHAGRVLDVYTRDGKTYIECEEGNTSSDLNDRNGGMVKIRERYAYDETIKGYCYIDYDESPIYYSTEKISVGNSGLRITANLNIRNNPGTSGTKVIGTYSENSWVYPYEKTFINGKPWYHTDKGWISATYCEGWVLEANGLWWFVMDGYSCTINDWQKIGSNWCFFDKSGWLVQSEWVDWNGKSYYLDKDGYMATNSYIKAKDKNAYYYVDSNGVWDNKTRSSIPKNAKVVI